MNTPAELEKLIAEIDKELIPLQQKRSTLQKALDDCFPTLTHLWACYCQEYNSHFFPDQLLDGKGYDAEDTPIDEAVEIMATDEDYEWPKQEAWSRGGHYIEGRTVTYNEHELALLESNGVNTEMLKEKVAK